MENFKLAIIAGHGDKDSGAFANGVDERDINLVVAKEMERILCDYCDVIMTRTDNDTFLTPEQCANIANNSGADLAWHVHHNAGGGDGFDIIHSVFIESSESDELAKLLAIKYKELGQNEHGVYSKWNSSYNENYYAALRHSEITALISEFAFMDSLDFEAIDSEYKLKQEAKASAETIIEFYGLQKEIPMTWQEILIGCLDSPEEAIKFVDTNTEIAKLKSDLGDLDYKNLSDLIIKVYNYGKEQ